MDWLYVFAGANIGILGTFLFVSERELKAKIRELDQLRRNQNDDSAAAEWMARNKELAEQVFHLSSRLEESRGTVDELKNEQQRFVDTQSENQNLQTQNQQLQQELLNVRNELQTTQSLLSTSASEYKEILKRDSQVQSELAESRQQLHKMGVENKARLEEINSLSRKLVASQTKTRVLEAVQQQLAEVQSREMVHRENQHKLEAQVAELRRELSSQQESIEELDETRRRLGEAEKLSRELREDNRRIEEEVSSWHERRRYRDEIQRRASAPPQQLEQVRTKQTLLDSKLQLVGGRTERKSNGNSSYPLPNGTNIIQLAQQSAESLGGVKEEVQPNRKWHFAMIPATGAIAIAGFVVVRFMGHKLG